MALWDYPRRFPKNREYPHLLLFRKGDGQRLLQINYLGGIIRQYIRLSGVTIEDRCTLSLTGAGIDVLIE